MSFFCINEKITGNTHNDRKFIITGNNPPENSTTNTQTIDKTNINYDRNSGQPDLVPALAKASGRVKPVLGYPNLPFSLSRFPIV